MMDVSVKMQKNIKNKLRGFQGRKRGIKSDTKALLISLGIVPIVFLLFLSPVNALQDLYFYSNGDLVAKYTDNSDEIVFYHQDMVGNNRLVSNGQGDVVGEYKSLPTGLALVDTIKDFTFSGKEQDESGLFYFNARYYDPELGTFIAVDPVEANQPFQYANNNPLKFIDPDGRQPQPATGYIGSARGDDLELILFMPTNGGKSHQRISGNSYGAYGGAAGWVYVGWLVLETYMTFEGMEIPGITMPNYANRPFVIIGTNDVKATQEYYEENGLSYAFFYTSYGGGVFDTSAGGRESADITLPPLDEAMEFVSTIHTREELDLFDKYVMDRVSASPDRDAGYIYFFVDIPREALDPYFEAMERVKKNEEYDAIQQQNWDEYNSWENIPNMGVDDWQAAFGGNW